MNGMALIREEPQEMWGGYVPYRPPKVEDGSEGQQGVCM